MGWEKMPNKNVQHVPFFPPGYMQFRSETRFFYLFEKMVFFSRQSHVNFHSLCVKFEPVIKYFNFGHLQCTMTLCINHEEKHNCITSKPFLMVDLKKKTASAVRFRMKPKFVGMVLGFGSRIRFYPSCSKERVCYMQRSSWIFWINFSIASS